MKRMMRLNMVSKEEENKWKRRQNDSKRDQTRNLTNKPDRPVLPTAVCVFWKYIWLWQLNWTDPIQTDPSCFLCFFPTPVLFFFLISPSVFEVFLECVWTAHGLFLMCASGQLLSPGFSAFLACPVSNL